MSNGWIKLHRQLLDWEWYDDINTSRLFIHLMITANHKDNNWRGIEIKRGSRLTSLDKLSSETNLSVSKIRTAIKKLISTNEIASKSHSQHTVFTMINYDMYQGDDKQVSKPVTNKSQTNDKRMTTNNNDKNEKNVNNIDIHFASFWESYPRKVGKPKALKAFNSAIKGMKLKEGEIQEFLSFVKQDCTKRFANTEKQFIPHPTSYINAEGWNDEY